MTLVLLQDAQSPLTVERQPEGVANREDVLRDLLFANPEMLPLRDLDPGIGKVVSVARELNVPDVGRIDALLTDERGRLVIVECKLWRNPQARREVVGQILDYARALARFSYDDLQREISSATRRSGNVLYELVRDAGSTIEEARFVDRVSRDLAAGRFILLVVGDGITEGMQRIGQYLQDQPGLAFTFGMVEMAQYRFDDPIAACERVIVQPRLLAKTVNLERIVIRSEAPGILIETERLDQAPQPTARSAASYELNEAWRVFARRLIERITFDDPGQPPARNGGMGWLRVPLPGPAALTLWRSHPRQVVGAFARFTGPDGLAAYEIIRSEQAMIDAEFCAAGLSAPDWSSAENEGTITLTAPALLPWDEPGQDAQAAFLAKAANQFVNSLRPRLVELGIG